MLCDWEIVEYDDKIVVLLNGPKIYGEMVREAFPGIPSSEDFAVARGGFGFTFPKRQQLSERIGYLLHAISTAIHLPGPWQRGFALDWYSVTEGNTRRRTNFGQMIYEYKYQYRYGRVHDMAQALQRFIRHHPLYQGADFIVPVPSNTPNRPFDYVGRLAEQVGTLVKIPVLSNMLHLTREARPQKDITTFSERQTNVSGLYTVLRQDILLGRKIIIIDDVYDSGTTMCEAAAALGNICLPLVLAKTTKNWEEESDGET